MTLRKSGWGGGRNHDVGSTLLWLVSTERYGSVQYSTVRNYLRFYSEVVKGTKIANRTTLLVPFPLGYLARVLKGRS